MVTHECIHLAVRKASLDRVPAWLDEGLATYLSQNLPRRYEASLEEAFRGRTILPLEALNGSFTRFDRATKSLAYAQCYSLVDYMVEIYGWELMRELIEGCGRGDSPDAVLRRWGLNGYLLEKGWEQQVRSGMGL